MLRTLFLLGFLGTVCFVAIKWATGEGGTARPTGRTARDDNDKDRDRDPVETNPEVKPTKPVRAEVKVESDPVLTVLDAPKKGREPLFVQDARIGLVDFPELGVQRSGKVLFLGSRLSEDEIKGKSEKELKPIAKPITRCFLAVETTEAELAALRMRVEDRKEAMGYQIPGDNRLWRLWRRNEDRIEPGKMNVVRILEWYTPLKEGVKVEETDILGMVDPQLTEAELFIKIAKLSANQAEVRAAYKTKEEAKVRYERGIQLLARGAMGKEEVDGLKLTWERYIEEEEGKKANVEVARREIAQTEGVLRQHEIKAPFSGVVRRLNKQADEAIKEQEPILLLQSLDRLQVEALVGEEHRRWLTRGMKVAVEPVRRQNPDDKMPGHREAVTAVAVGQAKDSDGKLVKLVLSAGEDRDLFVWEMRKDGKEWDGQERCRISNPAVVRSLACSPPGAKANLCLTGTSEGSVIIWKLDELLKLKKADEKQKREWLKKAAIRLKQVHEGPIFATAFSADGKWCATGSEDKSICLWNVEDLLSSEGADTKVIANAHKGAVTSLAFTAGGDLVSAGRDNRMVLWRLDNDEWSGIREIDQRSGQVEQLGVAVGLHRDDKQVSVLFDQGSSLRILDPTNGATRGILSNPTGGALFSTFALFSQDGQMILTTSAGENRLQLWSNPMTHPRGRARELRQLIWNDAPTTCAAFDPDGQFVVTGTRDRNVLAWTLPTQEELKEPPIESVIRHVGQVLDSSSRQVRVLVDVQRKNESLLPGDRATLIIYPR